MFAVLVAGGGCSTKEFRSSREPASIFELESFLATCRHAPLRLVAERVRLRPREPLELGGRSVLQMTEGCKRPPCRAVIPKGRFDEFAENYPVSKTFDPTDPRSPRSFEGKLVELHPPAGTFHLRADATEWIPIQRIYAPKMWGADPLFYPEQAASDGYALQVFNRDLSFEKFFAAVSPHFEIRLTDGSCPLPKAEQGNRCAQGRLPYDPSESVVAANYRAYLDSIGIFGIDVADRFYLDQNSRGYSYLVEYEDLFGKVVPGSGTTRFTGNRYVVIDALTEAPCPGWKIRRAALNAHNGHHPYAYLLDSVLLPNDGGEPGAQANRHWGTRTTKYLDLKAIEYRARDAAKIYKPGAELIFNLCFSLQLEDHRPVSIGNIFKSLPTSLNPIGSIRGVTGTCVNYSADADSAVVPPWLSPEHSDSPVYWQNPRFHGGSHWPRIRGR